MASWQAPRSLHRSAACISGRACDLVPAVRPARAVGSGICRHGWVLACRRPAILAISTTGPPPAPPERHTAKPQVTALRDEF